MITSVFIELKKLHSKSPKDLPYLNWGTSTSKDFRCDRALTICIAVFSQEFCKTLLLRWWKFITDTHADLPCLTPSSHFNGKHIFVVFSDPSLYENNIDDRYDCTAVYLWIVCLYTQTWVLCTDADLRCSSLFFLYYTTTKVSVDPWNTKKHDYGLCMVDF